MRSRTPRLASALLLIAACLLPAGCEKRLPTITLDLGGELFEVEVARTEQERAQGLKGRRRLGAREGMLFVFPADDRLDFWMQDTLIPLSIAFISADGILLEIRDMKPRSLDPVVSRLKARYALEVNRGAFDEAGVSAGYQLTFPDGFR